ncbi:hypothetical protein IT774_00545 [Salinimonas marina]|uniref:Uncharacterized protein n=1 Tax=Salinimonas marina TaxID=2785918 RepID=A0A7S9HD68_9ALTE|nr:hypothetical protein [Salinimonas marina]QPG05809.1 hypothetical protein IT774_00545 [Salinimonas marina]
MSQDGVIIALPNENARDNNAPVRVSSGRAGVRQRRDALGTQVEWINY